DPLDRDDDEGDDRNDDAEARAGGPAETRDVAEHERHPDAGPPTWRDESRADGRRIEADPVGHAQALADREDPEAHRGRDCQADKPRSPPPKPATTPIAARTATSRTAAIPAPPSASLAMEKPTERAITPAPRSTPLPPPRRPAPTPMKTSAPIAQGPTNEPAR